MPLRRTKRSDGQLRPKWKDDSQNFVENTHANESWCDEIALEPSPHTEQLVEVRQLLERNHKQEVSIRDRPARTGAGTRTEESAANAELCGPAVSWAAGPPLSLMIGASIPGHIAAA
jgi:hypothetical protein